ncbi:ATP-binding protein [Georgenia faecalis]|uniref:ATP-binding protein n=1 Tax=Georgenia faecalis TaxID=2483799 RepID=UPI000FDBDEF1|nr:tetratricopeptide repeat protein [Georgenia faecalis]
MSGTADGLPQGTLTLLFTDIEGSTRLLRTLGPEYAEVLTTQRAIHRDAFARWGGHELGTEGDSFFVVFTSAGAAVRAAYEAQRALGTARWPRGLPVRVRMGMHTGEPTRHEDGYIGMDVHLAARVAASAHGGQVLLSAATHRIASRQHLPGLRYVDLGVHRLKDIPDAEHLYQLAGAGLEERFPPITGLGARASLPPFRTSLVGRSFEVAETAALAVRTQVLTLTGPGGVGKTRLAVAAAAVLADRFADGVYFVPLASVRSREALWTTIAEVLGATGENRSPPTLLAWLARRELLLVLDNVEQLAAAPAAVAELTDTAPRVHVLATSRRPLHVHGEVEHRVGPLAVPAPGAGLGDAAASSAVELFVERARLVRPGFALTVDNVEDVAAICQRLDGLPLAIELVAARSTLLGPRALRARLDGALSVASADVDRPSRQRTLRAAIAWSYELLGPELRSAFAQLGVFEGGFGLDAVAAVVGPGGAADDGVVDAGITDGGVAGAGTADGGVVEGGVAGGGGAAWDPLDLVGALVDANLLMAREGPDGEPRLRMMRTIAAFAREVLEAGGDADATHRRHVAHYLGVVERVSPRLRSAQHLWARDRLEADLENIRAALRWSLGAADGDRPQRPAPDLAAGLRLCQQLGWFWYACGYHGEGRAWLRLAIDAGAGQESRELVGALHGLAVLLLAKGSAEQARDLLETCLDFWRRAGEPGAVAGELNSLALAHRALGDGARARELLEESLARAQEAGEPGRQANALSNLAALDIDAGDYDGGIVRLREVLAVDTELGDAWGMAADHVNIGGVLLRAGRLDEAEEHLARHGPAAAAMGDTELTVDVIELFCVVRALRGDLARSARLLGAAQRIREDAELPMPEPDAVWLRTVLDGARRGTDGTSWADQVAAGTELGVADALREALDGAGA